MRKEWERQKEKKNGRENSKYNFPRGNAGCRYISTACATPLSIFTQQVE